MPVDYTQIENAGVLLKGRGAVTGQEIYALNLDLYSSPEKIKATAFQIVDFTVVTEFDLTSDDVKRLAEQDKAAAKYNPAMLVAVVGSDDLVFGIARMWNAYASTPNFETSVFRTLEEARTWVESNLGS